MRVTHVLYSGLGGHSAVLFSLLRGGLLRTDQHSIIFAGVEPPPPDYLRQCDELKIDNLYIPKALGKGNLKFQYQIFRRLADLNTNILFVHGLAATPAIVLLKALCIGRRKTFVLLRETQANDLKSRREWLMLAIAHQFADRIVHLTEEAAQGAALYLGKLVRSQKVGIIPNGLDVDFYSPAPNSRSVDGTIHIGMQSRLQSNKDHPTLIKAFALIRDRHPSKSFHLHIGGDGSTYEAIKQMIDAYGLGKVVTLHGMLDQANLRALLQRLDIYVHCTHGETMSTALMQAISCGLPVIASNVAGVNNMILPNLGLLYAPGDENDLVKKIDGLVLNPLMADRFRECARSYALKNYSVANIVKSYEKLIGENVLQ